MIPELLLDGIYDDAQDIQHHVLHLSPDLFSLTSELPVEMFSFSILHNTEALQVILEGASVAPSGGVVCEPLEPQMRSHHPSGLSPVTVPSTTVVGTFPSLLLITAVVQEVEEGKSVSYQFVRTLLKSVLNTAHF
ncbi:UNVERIFIED_CONTAM: hypothetical protein K2H54_005345 [Gekko kuhli]